LKEDLTQVHDVLVLVGLEVVILLPQPPQWWDYRLMSPYIITLYHIISSETILKIFYGVFSFYFYL
jgi:hypothetical protein